MIYFHHARGTCLRLLQMFAGNDLVLLKIQGMSMLVHIVSDSRLPHMVIIIIKKINYNDAS